MFADGWRSTQIKRMGAMPWKGLYASLSAAGFLLIIWGFGLARSSPLILWTPPSWGSHLAAALMLLGFLFLVAAYVPGNRLKTIVGHPMLVATKTWAVAHLLANGTLADLILFGSFLIWAIADFAVSRRRDRAGIYMVCQDWGPSAKRGCPALGIGRDVLVTVIALPAFIWFVLYGHEWLIGVRPFA
ncbi:NnrU family protein [Undibacterium piscinae]|uniref:NnrU family protein n=1 Tax=Undibacterium piscinae TaxID=2495591 RepID=A0A6M4AAB4_9BURK|nr:NnrU family protein [Undibacterium piscinae]